MDENYRPSSPEIPRKQIEGEAVPEKCPENSLHEGRDDFSQKNQFMKGAPLSLRGKQIRQRQI